jgi:hypothetical protein
MSIIFASIICFLLLSLFIVKRWRINKSILEPGIIFAVNLILLYPVRAIILYIYGAKALPDYAGAENFEAIEDAIWVATIGCIGFILGYQFLLGRKKLQITKDCAKSWVKEDYISVAVCFGFALIGVTYKIATGDYMSYLLAEDKIKGISHVGTLLTSLLWPAYIGAWIIWFKGCRDKNFIIIFSCILVVTIPYQFIQGSKTFLSLLLLSIVISHYWAKGKVPRLTILVAIYLVITFVFPYVHNFREFVNSEYGKIPSLFTLDFQKIQTIALEKENLAGDKSEELLKISARFGGIDHLHGIIESVPKLMDYRYGFEYSAFFVNFIPRALWADKPIYSRGADYGRSLGTITSVTPFPVGEAYWDLGLYGTIIMMAIWGWCLAFVIRGYEYFYRRSTTPILIATYFLSQIYWISGGETSMPMVMSSIPQQLILIWMVGSVIKKIKYLKNKI